jgi:hypothetical protein
MWFFTQGRGGAIYEEVLRRIKMNNTIVINNDYRLGIWRVKKVYEGFSKTVAIGKSRLDAETLKNLFIKER